MYCNVRWYRANWGFGRSRRERRKAKKKKNTRYDYSVFALPSNPSYAVNYGIAGSCGGGRYGKT
jgi:hypothetical protein